MELYDIFPYKHDITGSGKHLPVLKGYSDQSSRKLEGGRSTQRLINCQVSIYMRTKTKTEELIKTSAIAVPGENGFALPSKQTSLDGYDDLKTKKTT